MQKNKTKKQKILYTFVRRRAGSVAVTTRSECEMAMFVHKRYLLPLRKQKSQLFLLYLLLLLKACAHQGDRMTTLRHLGQRN